MSWLYHTLKDYGLFAAVPIAAAAAAIYAVVRVTYLKASHKPRAAMSAEVARGLLVWYLVILIVLVWLPELPRLLFGKITLEEFAALTFLPGEYGNNGRFLLLLGGDFSVLRDEELIGNIVLFVPYGALLAVSFRRLRWWAVGLIGLGTTLLIELVQPLLERSCDLDDIIANTLGTLVGYAAAKLTLKAVSAARK